MIEKVVKFACFVSRKVGMDLVVTLEKKWMILKYNLLDRTGIMEQNILHALSPFIRKDIIG